MLLLLALWLYISFICFTWGIIVCRFFTRGQNLAAIEFPHVSMICLLGLAAVGTVGLYLSLYMPLSGLAHLIIALPVIGCWLYAPVRRIMMPAFRKRLLTGTVNWLLFLVLLLMTLSISSGLIIHPDTLSYHLQSIRWFEQFSAVPGIGNIDTELGMQSLWFAAHALFRTEIPAGVFALYLNGAVLSWFFLFICSQLHFNGTLKNCAVGLLAVMIFTLVSWTQVRLTAASASPDFIVVLYLLASAFLYLQNPKGNRLLELMTIMFACTAIAIKLSAFIIAALPMVLIVTYFRRQQYRAALRAIFLVIFLLTPVLVKNIIATGYPLFPSSFLSMDVPWKFPSQQLNTFREYIREYARWPSDGTPVSDRSSWIPGWWSLLSIADRLLIGWVLASIAITTFYIRKVIASIRSNEVVMLAVSIAGIIVWFVMAPDPRFATGYLLLVPLVIAGVLTRAFNFSLPEIKKLFALATLLIIVSAAAYTIYRLAKFSNVSEIVSPAGTGKSDFITSNCRGISLHYPLRDSLCGGIPVPCVPDSCAGVKPAGSSVNDGFLPIR